MTAFVAKTKNCKSGYLLHKNRKLVIGALPQDPDIQLQLPVSNNVFEVQAILLWFQLHVEKWVDSRVIVYTDSTTAFRRLLSPRLQGPYNQLLRKIIFIVARNDIMVEPRWLDSKANGLVNDLSWFNDKYITNICLS